MRESGPFWQEKKQKLSQRLEYDLFVLLIPTLLQGIAKLQPKYYLSQIKLLR